MSETINVTEGSLYAVHDLDEDSGTEVVEALYWQSEDSQQNYFIVGDSVHSGESEYFVDMDYYLIPVEARKDVTALMMDYNGNREDNIAERLELNDVLYIVDKLS